MAQNVFLPAGVEARYNVQVPMRDGVHLSADIYSPKGQSGLLPVVLSRTPYNNNEERFLDPCIFFAQHGYVAMVQDTRGRYDSEGAFYPWVNEYDDGYDMLVERLSHQLPSMPLVTPSAPEESYLVHKLRGTHLDVGGEDDAMPPGNREPLSEEEIQLVEEWILAGARKD